MLQVVGTLALLCLPFDTKRRQLFYYLKVYVREEVEANKGKEDAVEYKTIPKMEKLVALLKKQMEKAAKDMDFMEAARLRDEMLKAKRELEEMR